MVFRSHGGRKTMRVALAVLFVIAATAASALEVKVGPIRGPIQSKEPTGSGGGTEAKGENLGEVVVQVQLGRDPDGQRWINVWCRKITVD
jgi:hypothetical protein